jgi:hypothetical protein
VRDSDPMAAGLPLGTGPADGPAPAAPRHEPWLAVAILALSLLGYFGYQTFNLARERQSLRAALASQEPALQRAQRVRTHVDAVARGIQDLARHGNANAASIVEQLARRGITITAEREMPPVTAPPKR